MLLVIADASSLILLEKTELLQVLIENGLSFMIPVEVKREAVDKGKENRFPDAFKIEERINKGSITVKEVNDKKMANEIMKAFNVASGEAEAIALFFQEKANILATDDRLAINACKALNVPTSGSVAFVTESFERGLVNQNKAIHMLEVLANEGRYKNEIIFQALNKIQGRKDD